MTSFHRSLVAAATGAVLLGTAMPALAAGAKPLDAKVTYRAATDTYCINLTKVEGPKPGSLFANVECKSKVDWAAEGLTISRI